MRSGFVRDSLLLSAHRCNMFFSLPARRGNAAGVNDATRRLMWGYWASPAGDRRILEISEGNESRRFAGLKSLAIGSLTSLSSFGMISDDDGGK